jgi:hypothetical protein
MLAYQEVSSSKFQFTENRQEDAATGRREEKAVTGHRTPKE